jgi:hypothetical protein
MTLNLHRKLAIAGVVLFVSAACQKSNPARPSFVTPSGFDAAQSVSLTLMGLTGRFVGLANEICDGGAPVAIDSLKVDYEVSGASLAGALLVACDTEDCQGSSPLGTITECPLPPNPCEAGLPPAASEGPAAACLTGDPSGTGSLQVYAARPTDASASWHVMAYFADTGNRSNTVSGTVDQTQEQVAASNGSMDSARFARRVRQLHR